MTVHCSLKFLQFCYTSIIESIFSETIVFRVAKAASDAASMSLPEAKASSFDTPESFPSLPFFTTSMAFRRTPRNRCLHDSARFFTLFDSFSRTCIVTLGRGTLMLPPPPSSIWGLSSSVSWIAFTTSFARLGSKQVSCANVGEVTTTWATALSGVAEPYAWTMTSSNMSAVGSAPRIDLRESRNLSITASILPLTSSGSGRVGSPSSSRS
mmetsp:Transcript_13122/g.30901  ORF Transcript_13122/g.30901 Transcript_13122/m.30901 type:complete len:211 (-) Transcript_13122:76-708(-)